MVKAYIRSREYRSRAVSELAASDEETFTEIHLQNGKKYFPKFETSFSYLNNLKYRSYEPLVKCHFNHDLSAPQEKVPTMTVTSGIQIKKGSQHMRKAPIKKTWPTKGCKQTEWKRTRSREVGAKSLDQEYQRHRCLRLLGHNLR